MSDERLPKTNFKTIGEIWYRNCPKMVASIWTIISMSNEKTTLIMVRTCFDFIKTNRIRDINKGKIPIKKKWLKVVKVKYSLVKKESVFSKKAQYFLVIKSNTKTLNRNTI